MSIPISSLLQYDPAIRVTNLSKVFKIYSRPIDLVWETLRGQPRHRPFWALNDISFEVQKGQVVGLVGRNGAGKSTLLKIISGTLDASSGEVLVNGRISSILELGTGFNPEYSGRENIYLGGLMVGLSHDEIKDKESWIIEFSELIDFIDQPFKTYSTGMQARLTFATAVCIDPDILIVDEALAVGDARFQRKSFNKIEEFRKSGRTILLVSHDINTISSFCDEAIILDQGRIYDRGEPERISKIYYKMLFEDTANAQIPSKDDATEILEGEPTVLQLDTAKFVRERGYAWKIDFSIEMPEGDTLALLNQSKYLLFENDSQLRPGHAAHSQIREYGSGAYSHWGKQLFFSTSDNSDPQKNGRVYTIKHKSVIAQAEAAQAAESISPERIALRKEALERLGIPEMPAITSSRVLRAGNKKAEIIDYCILDQNGDRVIHLNSNCKYAFLMRVLYYEDVKATAGGFLIRDRKGVDVFGTGTKVHHLEVPAANPGNILEFRLDVTMWLTNGIYFLTCAVGEPSGDPNTMYDIHYDGLQFEIAYKKTIFTASIVDLEEEISCVLLDSARIGNMAP